MNVHSSFFKPSDLSNCQLPTWSTWNIALNGRLNSQLIYVELVELTVQHPDNAFWNCLLHEEYT